MDATEYLTAAQVSEKLGVTGARVRQLVRAGRLAGERWGKNLRIEAASVQKYEARPKGRHGFRPFMEALLVAVHKALPLLQSDCQHELQQAVDNVEKWLQKTRSRPYLVRPPVLKAGDAEQSDRQRKPRRKRKKRK